MMKRLLAAAVTLPMIAVAATVFGSEPPAQSGRALYDRYGCYACHGYVGAGGAMSGPALAGRGFNAGYVFDYARAPKGVMPLYRKSVLPDAQLSRIAEFVAGLPAGKPAAQIPELARLQARVGEPPAPAASNAKQEDRIELAAKAQFAGQCAACHGSTGEGGAGPTLRGGQARTAAQIMAIIRNPPQGMPQLTPHPIPDADLPALAKYVEGLGASAKP